MLTQFSSSELIKGVWIIKLFSSAVDRNGELNAGSRIGIGPFVSRNDVIVFMEDQYRVNDSRICGIT